jgi:hypothetical protein
MGSKNIFIKQTECRGEKAEICNELRSHNSKIKNQNHKKGGEKLVMNDVS